MFTWLVRLALTALWLPEARPSALINHFPVFAKHVGIDADWPIISPVPVGAILLHA